MLTKVVPNWRKKVPGGICNQNAERTAAIKIPVPLAESHFKS